MGLAGHIMITGGYGTLGRAIFAASIREGWGASFTAFGRSESRLAALKRDFPFVRTLIGDIRDVQAIAAAAAGHDLIVHAAAMKRIPECEAQPLECIATNVLGTANVLRAARMADAQVITISTDKACRAITTYGASKFFTESLTAAAAAQGVRATSLRYGNVIASTGSVIPMWREQARRGEVLGVTDMRMTRFWLTPRQAVALIVRAASTPSGSVLVPRLPAMRLSEIARAVAPGVELKEVGLRSTEKLHEDLVHADEFSSALDNDYLVWPHPNLNATTGRTLDSRHAEALSPERFLAMLAEVEADE